MPDSDTKYVTRREFDQRATLVNERDETHNRKLDKLEEKLDAVLALTGDTDKYVKQWVEVKGSECKGHDQRQGNVERVLFGNGQTGLCERMTTMGVTLKSLVRSHNMLIAAIGVVVTGVAVAALVRWFGWS